MTYISKNFERIFSTIAQLVYENKYLILSIMLLITSALAVHMPKLTVDTRDESFFHDDDPTLVAYNNFRDTFGQDDMFIIALKAKNGLDPEFITTLFRIHRELEASLPYLKEVSSLATARIMRTEGENLIIEDLMKAPPQTIEEVQQILRLVDRYPLWENLLISKDRHTVFILVKAQVFVNIPEQDILEGFDEAEPTTDVSETTYLSNDQNIEINDAIHKVINKYQSDEIEFHLCGVPAFIAEFQKGIFHDFQIMIPLSIFIITVFLFLLFRRISGVIYTLIIVTFSLIASFGIMAIFHIPITNATQILPCFLMVVGIGDSVHIMTLFYRNYKAIDDKKKAIIDAVSFAGLPILMTTVTTAFGLLSFAWADVAIIEHLGYVAPVGVFLAFIYTIILLPALIAIFPVKRPKTIQHKDPLTDRIFDFIARLTTNRPILVTVISAIILVTIGYGVLSLKFSHNSLTWLPPDSPVRKSTEFLDQTNGGTMTLNIIIDSEIDNGILDPELLRRIDELAQTIPSINVHGIKAGKTTSLADVLKEINRALNEDNDDAYVVPESHQLIAQELFLFEISGRDDLEEITDYEYTKTRLAILAPFADAILYTDYMDQVTQFVKKALPDQVITLTGHMVIFARIIKLFISSMVKSYSIAFVVITLLMILMIGRIGLGLMSMVANIVPIICIFGIMGYTKIPIDLGTVLLGSIILGIVVDDTIHFLYHFRKAYDETLNMEVAVHETLHTVGRAMLTTSLVLSGGFFIYTASFLENNSRFGLLTGFAVLIALAADFFLIPAFLTIMMRRK